MNRAPALLPLSRQKSSLNKRLPRRLTTAKSQIKSLPKLKFFYCKLVLYTNSVRILFYFILIRGWASLNTKTTKNISMILNICKNYLSLIMYNQLENK